MPCSEDVPITRPDRAPRLGAPPPTVAPIILVGDDRASPRRAPKPDFWRDDRRPAFWRRTKSSYKAELRTRVEDHDSAPIAAWSTSLTTMLAGQTTLKVSAAASNAGGVATGACLMEKNM